MKKLPKILVFLTFAVFLLALSETSVYAVPKLGVATQFAYVGGDGQTSLEDYQDYFVDILIPGTDETHGFLIGPSGSDLIVFTYLTDVDIYLLTTDDVRDANNPSLDGLIFEIEPDKKLASYTPLNYWGINLGKAEEWSDGLDGQLPDSFPGAQTFYARYVELTYDGTIAESSYFFAVADDDGKVGLLENKDTVSPKTDSAVGGSFPVPEPATMLLLGCGLIGLAGLGRKKFLKKA